MKLTSCLRFFALSLGLLLLPAFAAAQDSLKCESNDGNRQYCGSYNPDQVQFDRQISESPCAEGQTWGIDRDGLWVDRGCRATFIIRGGSDRGYQNRDDRPAGPGGPSGQTGQSSLTCSSDDGNRQYCGNYNPDQVRLDRQISGSPCTEGQTWGVDGQDFGLTAAAAPPSSFIAAPVGAMRDAMTAVARMIAIVTVIATGTAIETEIAIETVTEIKAETAPKSTSGGIPTPATLGRPAATGMAEIGMPAEPASTRTAILAAASSACAAENNASLSETMAIRSLPSAYSAAPAPPSLTTATSTVPASAS